MTVLADTHALHWLLTEPQRLSRTAFERLNEAERDEEAGIAVSVAAAAETLSPVAR